MPQLKKLIRSGYLNAFTKEKKILKNLTNISFEYKNEIEWKKLRNLSKLSVLEIKEV